MTAGWLDRALGRSGGPSGPSSAALEQREWEDEGCSSEGNLADAPSAAGPDSAPASQQQTSLRQPGETFRSCINRLEARVLLEALREADGNQTGLRPGFYKRFLVYGNQTEAAKLLDMPRRTLVHKIRVLGLRRLGWTLE